VEDGGDPREAVEGGGGSPRRRRLGETKRDARREAQTPRRRGGYLKPHDSLSPNPRNPTRRLCPGLENGGAAHEAVLG